MLVENLPGSAILLLASYRPGYQPPWIGKSYVTQMALPCLTPCDSLEVVYSVLQQETLPQALVQIILAKADGNPLFLEELTRSLMEHGSVRGDTAVPDTIQGVLMARIDRLPDAPKRLIQAAAVLCWRWNVTGPDFPSRVWRIVSAPSPHWLASERTTGSAWLTSSWRSMP